MVSFPPAHCLFILQGGIVYHIFWQLQLGGGLLYRILSGEALSHQGSDQGRGCNRYTYDYDPIPGLGHFLHTYVCDGNPVIPTFQGEPELVAIPQDMEAFVDTLWKTLNEDNKISLFVRYTDLATGEYRQRIINRYE